MRIYVWYGIDLFGLKKPVISIKRYFQKFLCIKIRITLD
jgi:hypothetical protein